MKKTIKVLAILFVTIAMLFTVAQPVAYAKIDAGTIVDNVDNDSGSDFTSQQDIQKPINTAIKWIQGIAVVAAIIVLLIIGIQFMVGGTQGKAEYKKALIPVFVGIMVVVFATTIVRVAFSMN